jgi:tetratricopeptide (TPR) repeat protein
VFARAVNENQTIQSALNEVIFYKVDCEKGEGPAIAKKYGVRGYPTFMALNGHGEITDRWIGYEGPEAWAMATRAAAADPRTIPAKKAAFEAEPSAKLARCLANEAAARSGYAEAVGYLRQAREMDPDGAAGYTRDILTSMYYGARDEVFTLDEIEIEARLALGSPEATVGQKVELALMLRDMARQADLPGRAVPYIVAALQASEGTTDEEIMDSRVHLQIDKALLVDKDPAAALELFRTTFDEGWQDNAGQLNNFAWWCFENNVNLAEAEDLIMKAVTLAETDGERANILDTAAEICNKRGNCEDAVARIKQAIELAPDKQYFKDQLVRFEQALKEKQEG